MSTRSVIARPTPDGGFHGTYCHNDGYPAHQGRILFDAVTGNFDGDPDAACRYLIDQHPAGWSVLGGDFTAPPGYRTGHDPQDLRNQCYCHGDRQEPPRPPLTDHTARDAWVDYAYVLEAERLRVLTNRAGGWQPVAEPTWTEQPDWTPSTSTPNTSAAGGSTTTSSIADGRHGRRERPGGHRQADASGAAGIHGVAGLASLGPGWRRGS
jgi:hypothetical protein